MRYLTGAELEEAKKYIRIAAEYANKSTCVKSKRGVVIVKNGLVIGSGYNDVTIENLCNPCIREEIKDDSRIELCSAVHAEHVAIIDALKKGHSLEGSRMYHIKVKDGELRPSGQPSCTICSREILRADVSEVVLWHKEGYAVYGAPEFNEISFQPFLKKIK
jgi:dCMP deaminase